ncbi:hypothetical protein ACFLIM_41795 [Nonomuraea sp. M3C6]|uniref:Uncharacterized protein n=1 Tax=Nonomuraea marmarensis TaxID=3351344 RepID=A0ABW7AUK3_9ACTN
MQGEEHLHGVVGRALETLPGQSGGLALMTIPEGRLGLGAQRQSSGCWDFSLIGQDKGGTGVGFRIANPAKVAGGPGDEGEQLGGCGAFVTMPLAAPQDTT